jgi:hypothetical protein
VRQIERFLERLGRKIAMHESAAAGQTPDHACVTIAPIPEPATVSARPPATRNAEY